MCGRSEVASQAIRSPMLRDYAGISQSLPGKYTVPLCEEGVSKSRMREIGRRKGDRTIGKRRRRCKIWKSRKCGCADAALHKVVQRRRGGCLLFRFLCRNRPSAAHHAQYGRRLEATSSLMCDREQCYGSTPADVGVTCPQQRRSASKDVATKVPRFTMWERRSFV